MRLNAAATRENAGHPGKTAGRSYLKTKIFYRDEGDRRMLEELKEKVLDANLELVRQ